MINQRQIEQIAIQSEAGLAKAREHLQQFLLVTVLPPELTKDIRRQIDEDFNQLLDGYPY